MGRMAEYVINRSLEETWMNTLTFFNIQKYFIIYRTGDTDDGGRFIVLKRKLTFSSSGYQIHMVIRPSNQGTLVHVEVELNYGWGPVAYLSPNRKLKEWAIHLGTKPVNLAKGVYIELILTIGIAILLVWIILGIFQVNSSINYQRYYLWVFIGILLVNILGGLFRKRRKQSKI